MGESVTTQMSKLFITCVLCAIVFATSAPESFIENDALVHEALTETDATQGPVDALKNQFDEITTKLKDGAKVGRSMKETINTMLALIEGSIQPSITTAHTSDQARIHESHSAVNDLDSGWKITFKGFKDQSSVLHKQINSHNDEAKLLATAAQNHKNRIKDYESKVSSERKKCCTKDNLAVPQLEYTPANAVCDYTAVSSAQVCIDAAKAALSSAVDADFTQGVKRYKAAANACRSAVAANENAKGSYERTTLECFKRIGIVTSMASVIHTALPKLRKSFSDTGKMYKSKFTKAMASYHKVNKDVKKNAKTRKVQWASVVEIKCMLKSFRDGGKFNKAAWKKCRCFVSKGAQKKAGRGLIEVSNNKQPNVLSHEAASCKVPPCNDELQKAGKKLIEVADNEKSNVLSLKAASCKVPPCNEELLEEESSVDLSVALICVKKLGIVFRKIPTELVWKLKPFNKLSSIKTSKKTCALKEQANEKAKCIIQGQEIGQVCKTGADWTRAPTKQPTKQPTKRPTKRPTKQPTKQPTKKKG